MWLNEVYVIIIALACAAVGFGAGEVFGRWLFDHARFGLIAVLVAWIAALVGTIAASSELMLFVSVSILVFGIGVFDATVRAFEDENFDNVSNVDGYRARRRD